MLYSVASWQPDHAMVIQVASETVINIALLCYWLIEMEQVTEFMIKFLGDRPVLYADLTRSKEAKEIIPFGLDLKSLSFSKRLSQMTKHHYYAFHLRKKCRLFRYIVFDSTKFSTAKRFQHWISRIIWLNVFVSPVLQLFIAFSVKNDDLEEEVIFVFRFILGFMTVVCLVALLTYIVNVD